MVSYGVKTGNEIKIDAILSQGEESPQTQALARQDWEIEFLTIIQEWKNVHNPILLQRASDFYDSGRWSTIRYNNWLKSVYEPMEEITNRVIDNKYMTQRDYLFWVDEVYHQIYDADLSLSAWQLTSSNPTTFILFMAILFLALISMSLFRSPAVALMPDITIKPLRSKGNAIINLMGTIGGMIAILILTILGLDNASFVNYSVAFLLNGLMMFVLLAIFLMKVREMKWVKEREIKV